MKLKKKSFRNSCHGFNRLRIHCSSSGHFGDVCSFPGPVQWVKGSCIAAAVAQVATEAWIQSLGWELLCAVGAAIKLKKNHSQIYQPTKTLTKYMQNLSIPKTTKCFRVIKENLSMQGNKRFMLQDSILFKMFSLFVPVF